MKTLEALWADESGVTLVEYALLIGMLGAVVIACATMFLGSLQNIYKYIAATLSKA